MKPRTNLQKKVAELAKQLPALTEEQRRWAEDKCFEKTGYLVRKNRVWCHECGTEFNAEIPPLGADLDCAYAVCPVCGKRIKIENSHRHQSCVYDFFTILTTISGMQVCRHFEIIKYSFRGMATKYSICEVVQNWIDEKGRETIVARSIMSNCYKGRFMWSSDLSLKVKNLWGGYYSTDYDINPVRTYPERKILPILRRNGYTARFRGIAPNVLFGLLLKDNEAETLIKTKRYALLEMKYTKPQKMREFASSIKVMMRHHYEPKNVQMWFDYMGMCKNLGMDIHNPLYVCPKNLKKAHDTVMKKLERKREKEQIEQEKQEQEKRIAEAAKWEDEYKKEKGRFFGICFGDDNLVITVVKSVAEMAEEGKAMHHCVFQCAYYKNPQSLIMSARDKAGNRVETIEVNLKTFDVVQSRGVCNQDTKYHQEIINLVRKNINLIKKVA